MLNKSPAIHSISETSIEFAPGMKFEEWESIGRDLQRIGRCWQWWVGDWLNFGESQYGEKYSQAIEVTGIAYQTLMNCAWVASRVEISRRREIVSWSHHSEIAKFDPKDQEKWLKLAEKKSLSRSELREAIKDSKQISRRREIVDESEVAAVIEGSTRVQKPGRESISPAKVIDAFYQAHFPPLVRGIDAAAAAIGAKGPNHKKANDALNSFSDAVGRMREGEQ